MKKIFFLLVLCLVMQACSFYRKVEVTPRSVHSNEKIVNSYSNYDIYFHDYGNRVYRAIEPTISNDTIKTKLVQSDETEVLKILNTKDTKVHKNEIHYYLTDSLTSDGSTTTITEKQIDHLSMYAKDDDNTFKKVGLIITGAIVGGLLLFGLTVLLFKASGEAADESSAGSNSGSDSGSGDSGGSDSGGSNSGGGSDSGGSGGSNSDSGCYVATMVYGSYEAPEVLVLRKFRDQILKKSRPGRAFIRWYYRNSPDFVARNKNKRTLNYVIRGILNQFVNLLRFVNKW